MTYGKRTCLCCGAEFEAGYPAQVTCGAQCRTKRNTDVRKRRDRERYLEMKGALARVAELEAEIAALQERIATFQNGAADSADTYDALREKITRLEAEKAVAEGALSELARKLEAMERELAARLACCGVVV